MEEAPPFIQRARAKGLKLAGVKYEEKAHEYLGSISEFYLPGMWLAFTARGHQRIRWCQPDGIILDFVRGHITVVEVKLKHVVQSWWQLRHLYEPVLRALFAEGDYTYSVLEVACYVDPHLDFPEQIRLVRDPRLVPEGKFGVHIYNPRRF